MNKVIAAAGLALVSAASLQAQYDVGSVSGILTPLETSKPWSISGSVRGFYDDNYLTLPKSYPLPGGGTGHPLGSWGTEVTPAVAANHTDENTVLTGSYVYDLEWYDNGSNLLVQTHQFNGSFQHQFSDRYKLSLVDGFAIAQEPDTLVSQSGPVAGVISSPLRVSGSNIRNTGQADFTASLTKLFDVHVGYGNTVYAYSQVDRSVFGYPFTGAYSSFTPEPSYSDLLDRMEQLATLDLRWKATPETTGVLGYQYGHTAYTSPGYIIYPYGGNSPYLYPALSPGEPAASLGYRSNIRNDDSHFGFVGVDESFTPTINGSLRVGAEYLDYYNYGTSRVSPYVDASIIDQYLPGDSVQLGVKHVHNSTDVVGYFGTTPVLDEESTAIYLSDSHRLTERLSVSVMGQAQLSTFDGGGAGYNGKEEDFFIAQINFAYHFNPWLMTELGYNYSKLNSPLLYRAYTRDVMYLGFRAVY
jgi:hypothetical protein